MIAGTYKGETTESCERIQSSWVYIINKRLQSGIQITQNGSDAEVILRGKHEGKQVSLNIQSVIVESSVSLADVLNSDYFFRGEIKDQAIVIKPNLSVLDTWAEWSSPASQKDLKNCTITLKLLSRHSNLISEVSIASQVTTVKQNDVKYPYHNILQNQKSSNDL